MVSQYLERPLRTEEQAVIDGLADELWNSRPNHERLLLIEHARALGIDYCKVRAEAWGVPEEIAARRLHEWGRSIVERPGQVVDILA